MREDLSNHEIARLIDHTLLKPEVRSQDIEKLCQEALNFSFYSVCVAPPFVRLASQLLANSDPLVCTVIGFPTGGRSSALDF